MSEKADKTMRIVAAILCCVLVVAIAIIVIHSNGILSKPQSNTEPPSVSDNTIENSSELQSVEPEQSTSAKKPQNTNSIAVLVNKDNPVPEDWKVELVQLRNNQQIDRRAYNSLQKMFDDARTAGYEPIIVSSYRTREKQLSLYNQKVDEFKSQGKLDKDAKELASQWVAIPGTSEHELGLAVDIATTQNQKLDETQLNSPCQLWLIENSWKYGFILRYPQEKKDITKINFEPWHYRFVGPEIAKEIHENNICLEEYYAQ